MNKDGFFSPSQLFGTNQPVWQTSETLSDLLSKTTDLRNACQVALQFILQAAQKPAGVILIPKSEITDRIIIPSSQLSQIWLDQISIPTSPLCQSANYVYTTGSIYPSNEFSKPLEPPTDLASILPITVMSNTIAVLLIQGDLCSTLESEKLTQLTIPLGRVIRLFHSQVAKQSCIKDLADLQIELSRMESSTDFEGIQVRMIQGIKHILDGEASAIVLLDENHKEWIIRKSLGWDTEWIYQVNPREGKGLVKECLQKGKIVRINDVSKNLRFDPFSDGLSDLETRSLICAPIMDNEKVIGCIQVLNKINGEFDEYDQYLLSMLTVLAANTFQRASLIKKVKTANTDLEVNRWDLNNSRNMLSAICDNLPASLYIIDQNYKLIQINKSRAVFTGHSAQFLQGKLCYQVFFNRDKPCSECLVVETLKNGSKTQRSERRWNVTSDDSSEWEISSYPIFSENKRVIQAILIEQDVSEKHRLEATLAQTDKLAVIGQLAAGIAHEINNPLTAIIANAQILHRELDPDEELQESVDLIARAGARAAQVVRNLLDFARKEEYHLRVTDLNETLEKALYLIQHELLARRVQLEFTPDPQLPLINASQDHLQSVWLNLLLNAIDSLDKKPGEVKITTSFLNDEIHVSVADNGKGIRPENLTRVFEPFYTTKAPGRGTGLGLSVSHRIVKQHGGNIRVQSQVGSGSIFTVVIPTN